MDVNSAAAEAFYAYLEKEWPLWKGHIGSVHYQDLRKAFFAGYEAGGSLDITQPQGDR
jgi:hypothetical protein